MPKKKIITDSAPPVPEQTWKNRIVGHRAYRPDELLANPFNYKIHGYMQQQAMENTLDTLGWLAEVVVNVTTGHIVDGHMRATIAIGKNELVPATEVELSLEEEQLALATFDPIGDMAVVDKEQYGMLMNLLRSDDDRMGELMAELSERFGVAETELPAQPTNAYNVKNPFAAQVQAEADAASNGSGSPGSAPVRPGGSPEPSGGGDGAMAPATVKIVQVYLEPGQYDGFMSNVRLLAERYATTNVTDTIVQAIGLAAAMVQVDRR